MSNFKKYLKFITNKHYINKDNKLIKYIIKTI